MKKNYKNDNPKLFNNEGHLTETAISLYVDGLISGRIDELPLDMLDHVENCLQCKREVLSLHEILKDQDFRNSGSHPYFDRDAVQPETFWARERKRVTSIPPHFLKIAAVLLVGSLIALLWYLSIFTAPESKFSTNSDSLNAQLLAANFKPSLNLENIISEEYRSQEISILSPGVGANYNGDMIFRWQNGLEETLYLNILNNKEAVIYQFETTRNQVFFDKPLVPGLYYWKLETKDDLLYVGKFFVNTP